MTDDIQRAFDELAELYACELPTRLQDLQRLWQRTTDDGLPAYEGIQRACHSLSGSAASFGFLDIAAAAAAVERQLLPVTQEGCLPELAARQQIQRLLMQLARQLSAPQRRHTTLKTPSIMRDRQEPRRKQIYLVDDDIEFGRLLSLQIKQYGYDVLVLSSTLELPGLIGARGKPDILLMDVDFPEGQLAGPDSVRGLRATEFDNVPVIFMSHLDSTAVRLAAVRAGGDAFFTKPIDPVALIDRIDHLLNPPQSEVYRILIVEDERSLAELYARTLQDAGLQARIETDPMQVPEVIDEYKPDLLLMDLYMPGCNGLELSKVIRQQSAYLSLPIVFLSAEKDLAKQMRAMEHGGDDFLVKPIDPQHLTASVLLRAERYHALRSQMVRDSMTGLLNHAKILDSLDMECLRSQRNGAPLSFVMIDVDWFKSINDRHGHAAGDRVILALSRLLRERLRKTDLIGRYGGEEFALVLTDTPADKALLVIESLRETFAEMTFYGHDDSFQCTFSAGVAGYDPNSNCPLARAADLALYAAKAAGRNRVQLADTATLTRTPMHDQPPAVREDR